MEMEDISYPENQSSRIDYFIRMNVMVVLLEYVY